MNSTHTTKPNTSKRELVYLGWQGNDNFGDELLWDAWKVALGRDLSVTAPLTLGRYLVKNVREYLAQRIALVGSERLVILGGGTTIGFGTWARHTRLAKRMYRAAGVVIPGAGAASSGDSFSLSRQPADWDAWQLQRDIALYGVRGPLTVDECEAAWRPTAVIGDPALLYPLHAGLELPAAPANRIGLCLGSDKATRFDLDTVVAAVKTAAEARGSEVVVFQVADTDSVVAEATAAALGPDVRIVRFTGSVAEMMQELANCRIVISERLHGAVAAVSLGVATVPLSYASKCDDFWMSVAGERAPITIGHTAEELVEAIDRSEDPALLARIADSVETLQDSLERAAAVLRGWLDGSVSTAQALSVDAHKLLDGAPRTEVSA